MYKEQCFVALKTKLLRQIMQPYASVISALPIQGCEGFFIDSNSSLRYTKSVIFELPVHPQSNVTFTKLLSPIPGVPAGYMTNPPLYIVNYILIIGKRSTIRNSVSRITI
jgi:hypothetical protein